jgi:5-methyltetrahydrofolate--homocysteine methyltransferase
LLLNEIVKDQLLQARAIVGLYPAGSRGDDIEIYSDQTRSAVLQRFCFLRQQRRLSTGRHNTSLADFIAPADTGIADYIGLFAVSAGFGAEKLNARFVGEKDDYKAIMVKVLADRLAEALAERMHQLVRTDLWGYASSERLDNEALIAEKYQGIRPAPGYPACPDHTQKIDLFRLLEVSDKIDIKLTENCAMYPNASVSGFYLSHPQARYIQIGRIGRDQVEDYAARTGMSLAEAERWLAPNLAYDPAEYKERPVKS